MFADNGARQEWHCLKRVFGSCGGEESLEIHGGGRLGAGSFWAWFSSHVVLADRGGFLILLAQIA